MFALFNIFIICAFAHTVDPSRQCIKDVFIPQDICPSADVAPGTDRVHTLVSDNHNVVPGVDQIEPSPIPSYPRIQPRKDPFWATQVGEASNPGPDPFKFEIVNPTAVLGKIDDICPLKTHVVALSENCATKSVQLETSQSWRNKGYKSIWSAPVATHTWSFKEDEANRGQASGVSLHSQIPIRNTRIPLSEELDQTRILSAIVQCGKWPIHIITIYGYPQCQRDSQNKTNQLLLEAANHAEQSRLPAIIVGHFNVPCTELSTTQGYQTIEQIYCQLYGCEMPFTCRAATRPDQALVHPKILPYISYIEVNKTKVVPDHDPVGKLVRPQMVI